MQIYPRNSENSAIVSLNSALYNLTQSCLCDYWTCLVIVLRKCSDMLLGFVDNIYRTVEETFMTAINSLTINTNTTTLILPVDIYDHVTWTLKEADGAFIVCTFHDLDICIKHLR